MFGRWFSELTRRSDLFGEGERFPPKPQRFPPHEITAASYRNAHDDTTDNEEHSIGSARVCKLWERNEALSRALPIECSSLSGLNHNDYSAVSYRPLAMLCHRVVYTNVV